RIKLTLMQVSKIYKKQGRKELKYMCFFLCFLMSVSLVIHSSSCGDQAKEQGDKAVNKDKGKSHIVTIIGFRDLNEEFAKCINNSSNGVSAAGPSVSAAGLDFTNSTNDFTAAVPLVSAAELNFTNSTSNFGATGPLNAAMPNLEDLSHDADDVGAEADTNYMESIISTMSMARGVKDQGGISQMFNEDFHTCICNNGTEFKNVDLNQFCELKGIKREFSVPRTPQQNGIAERKNRTLIEAARTLLADSFLPIPFWAEAVNTACYVQNRQGI
nr:putative ribonuclease H-like domain-containing protein [Tanacetum cinerariifolium]